VLEVPRPSPVRDAVAALVESGRGRHLWALDELLDEIRAEISSADFSTVFRAASALEKEGRLVRVDLGDGKVRYERAGNHHDHIQCSHCGAVAEVPGCVLDDLATQVEHETGYAVEGHRLIFTGRCPACPA
jgi:Fur family transcriptional regulator, ferric uptake regulator